MFLFFSLFVSFFLSSFFSFLVNCMCYSKDNANSNDSGHIFVIRENTHLKHRCLLRLKILMICLYNAYFRIILQGVIVSQKTQKTCLRFN